MRDADEPRVSAARSWLVLLAAGAGLASLVLAALHGTPGGLLLSAVCGSAAVSLARVGLSRRINGGWIALGALPAVVAIGTRLVGV